MLTRRILAEKIGRKWTILGLAIPFIISWIIIAAAYSVPAVYVARVFAGISTGGICVTAPLYIGETAETSVRGSLGSYFQVSKKKREKLVYYPISGLFIFLVAYGNFYAADLVKR